jgi:hypothetical protein
MTVEKSPYMTYLGLKRIFYKLGIAWPERFNFMDLENSWLNAYKRW